MPTFKHSGDLGDIIYALPTLRALGGGILYLDLTGGQGDPLVAQTCVNGRTKFNQAGYDTLRPLLLEQPYVSHVKPWQGEAIDFDLNRFRRQAFADNKSNLAICTLREFGQPVAQADEPWLTVRQPLIPLGKPLVINRTLRFQSKYHWWALNINRLAPHAVFVGLEREHDAFQYTFDCTVDFRKAVDAAEIARMLLGAQLVGNQSFIMSIAIGLGVPYIQEVYDYTPNCRFNRSNGQYF